MHKCIDTIIFEFNSTQKIYTVNVKIDSILLEVQYVMGYITLYHCNAYTSISTSKEYHFYTTTDNIETELKYTGKHLIIENQLYFIFERTI